MSLHEHQQRFIDSYRNISFYGERRGAEDCNYFSGLLKDDLKELGENQGNYKEKFINKIMLWVDRQSRTASSFITGPANFPINNNRKKMDSADKAWSDFWYWRKKYFKAVNRVRTPSPEQEIDSAIVDISKLINYQLKAKETNKLLRKYKIVKSITIGFEKNDSDNYTGKVFYKVGEHTECDDFDLNTGRECGGGLHLSPTPRLAKSFHRGKLKNAL